MASRGLVIAAVIMIVVGLIVYAIGIYLVFNATGEGSTALWITIFLALVVTMIGIVLLIVGENR